jgi:hypothetical protein
METDLQEVGGRGRTQRDGEIYLQEKYMEPGVVIHAYKPSYLGSRDWEDCGSRPAQAKKKKL